MKCSFPACHRRSLLRVGGVHVCPAHWTTIDESAVREANIDHPEMPRFRFVRRRGGYETWLSRGRSSSNLTAYGLIARLPLAKAQAKARAYAAEQDFAYVDEERVLDRSTLHALFAPEPVR